MPRRGPTRFVAKWSQPRRITRSSSRMTSRPGRQHPIERSPLHRRSGRLIDRNSPGKREGARETGVDTFTALLRSSFRGASRRRARRRVRRALRSHGVRGGLEHVRASVEVHICDFAADAVEDRDRVIVATNGDNEAAGRASARKWIDEPLCSARQGAIARVDR